MPQRQWRSHWGVKGGQSATPDSEKFAKIGEKSGKKRKSREEKGKKREGSFTLHLLTDRAGYAIAQRYSWQRITSFILQQRHEGIHPLFATLPLHCYFKNCWCSLRIPPHLNYSLLFNTCMKVHGLEGSWMASKHLIISIGLFCSARCPTEATDVNPTLLRSSWCCLATFAPF